MTEAERLNQALEKLNKQQEARIREQEQTIRELQATIADLRVVIANLEETLKEFKRKLFGTSSEKAKEDRKDPVSEEAVIGEEKTTTVEAHTRTIKPKSVRKELYEPCLSVM